MTKSTMTRVAVFAAAVATSLAASAKSQEVSLWRGETCAVLVNDSIELGADPEGLSVRKGVLRRARYRPNPRAMQIAECYDIVEWGIDGAPCIVEITAPSDAKPGVIKWGDLDIRVVDRVLPPAKDWKYHLDLWQHPWAVARVSRSKPFSKEHYDAMRPTWELLASAGQKVLTTTLVDQPWNHQCRDAYGTMIGRVRNGDGTWRFDYSIFDEYVEFGRSCGIGPHIACYTMCPWGYKVSWHDDKGEEHHADATPGSEAFKDFWGAFLVDFASHLKAKGWFADTYIAMDERSPEDVKAIADFIQERAPGMKISMAGNRKPSDFKGITIDNYSQLIRDISPEFLEELSVRRAQGMTTTFYVCCSPKRPNNFLESESAENFWIGAYPAMVGFDGFLRWAWNSWPDNPFRDASFYHWRAGDTFLVYPGAVPSYRFLELRNGIVTAEKLRILREQGLFADEISALAARYDFKAAMDGKADFSKLREDALSLVNR